MRFERITVRPGQMGGQPCIRGLRIPVATVVDMVADGMSTAEVVAALPDLEPADVAEALHYGLYAASRGERPLIRAVGRVSHLTPEWSNMRRR